MGKKKLCLVIPSLQAGGMERVMSELAGYFSLKEGIETHLVLFGITREIFYAVPSNVFVHKPPFKFNARWRLYSTVKTLIYLRTILKKIDPESILSFGEYWNNFLLLSIYGLKYNIFISERAQPGKSLGWLHDKLRQRLYPMANGLILQTEKAKEIYLKKNRHHNIAVIGNPIRNFDFAQSSLEREKNVLMVGRLIKSKHQDKLIEMFARVSPSDWKLILVGYDHLKQSNLDRLQALTRDLKVEQKVVFTGKMDNVDEIYLRSSIFAFTSSSEGFPNVIGEAMAAGLPVVSFDCVAGPSEMIKDNHNGFIIPLFDYELFQEKLELLMKNEDLRTTFGANAREDIKKFSVNKIGGQYLEFLLNKNHI